MHLAIRRRRCYINAHQWCSLESVVALRSVAVFVLLLGAGVGGLWSAEAQALELVAGGYGTTPTDVPVASGEPVQLNGPSTPVGLALDFTPRDASLWPAGRGDSTAPDMRFGLTVHGSPDSLDQLGFESAPGAPGRRGHVAATSALTVGGAMRWSDWSVGGGVGRAQILGEDVGVMSANLSYGRISTELAYGQGASAQGGSKDVLMLSTDLAAWSWLTLESDLAVGTSPGSVDRERDRNSQPVAAGRFGLRLNF
ncbi:MAG: hypothetical protein WAS21_03550 [Geminicoccaceae bacterium]